MTLAKEMKANRGQQQKLTPSLQAKGHSPNQDEIETMHQLFKESMTSTGEASGSFAVADGYRLMENWTFTNSIMIYPERRNMHGKLFGGYVASTAYDLAYYTARAFCGGTLPFALGFDQMRFFNPVSIGDQLHFTARVVHSAGRILRVWVDVERLDPVNIKGGNTSVGNMSDTVQTNQMEFIFAHPTEKLPRIVPKTYTESLKYLGAQRRYESEGPTDERIGFVYRSITG